MAMTFEQWFSAQRQQMLGDAERDIITRLAESLRDQFAPAPMSPDDAFDALAEHTLPQYTYSALAQGITPCLQNHILNCGAAANTWSVVLLSLSGTSLEVQRFLGAVNGNTARSVLTPSSEHPGVRVTQERDERRQPHVVQRRSHHCPRGGQPVRSNQRAARTSPRLHGARAPR